MIQTAEHIQQGAFARAGGTEDDADLALFNGKAGVGERADGGFSASVLFGCVFDLLYMTKPLLCDQAAWKIRRGLMLDTTNHNIAQEGCKVNETGSIHVREMRGYFTFITLL